MKTLRLLVLLTTLDLTLLVALGVDTDGDGLDDAVETTTGIYVSSSNTGTDPSKADTDGDGMNDGYELGLGRISLSAALLSAIGSQNAAESSAEGAHLLTLESDAEWEFFATKILPSLMPAMPAGQTSAWVGAQSSTYGNGDALTWIGSKPWQWHTGKRIDLTKFAPGTDGTGGPPYYENPGRAAFSTTTLNLAGTINTTSLPSFVEVGRFSDPNVKDSRELLFSNADFSSGNLSGWTSEGAGPTFLPDGSVFIQEFTNGGSLYTSQEFLVPVQRGLRGLVFRIFRPAGISSCNVRVRVPADNINILMKETPYGAFHDCYVDLSDFAGKSIQVGVGGGSVQFSKVEALISEPLYTLALAPASHGAITGSGTFPSGFASTLIATPESGYVFAGWTGDASGATNPLQLVMNADKIVGATFAPDLADNDNDGLSNFEEVITYHTNPDITDTDGDGFNDGFEVSTGFSATSAASTPDTLSSIRTAVEYRFNAALGVSYRIESSTDLATWTTIETPIVGTTDGGGIVTRFYSVEGQQRRFYRSRRN